MQNQNRMKKGERMSDLISRQVAIDALSCENPTEPYIYYDDAVKAIKELPSAEPEKHTNERTETHECDYISRQVAIDAFMGEPTDAHYPSWYAEKIKELPPAQPERKIHFADADHVWIDGKQYISLGRFQEAVVEAQPERTGRWIDETFKAWGLVHHPYRCSLCGEHAEYDSMYCPNCGAKMEVEHDR